MPLEMPVSCTWYAVHGIGPLAGAKAGAIRKNQKRLYTSALFYQAQVGNYDYTLVNYMLFLLFVTKFRAKKAKLIYLAKK